MNLDHLHNKLIAAARTARPDERVPYAFEKRIMARLSSVAPLDPLALWSRGLWRAALSCVIVTGLCVAWATWSQPEPQMDLAQEFESAILASTSPDEVW